MPFAAAGMFFVSQSAFAQAECRLQPWQSDAVPIQPGECIRSSLAGEGAEAQGAASYALRLAAGQGVQIDVESDAFDPEFEFNGPIPEPFGDEDSGEGANARVQFTAEVAGIYSIRIKATSGSGDYVLRVKAGRQRDVKPQVTVLDALASAPIVRTGRFSSATALLGHNPYAEFRFRGEAGSLVRAAVKSAAFAPSIKVLAQNVRGGDFYPSETSLEKGSAQLYVILPATLDYTIQVSAGSETDEGAYSLEVERVDRSRAATRAEPIAVGAPVRGTLSAATSGLGRRFGSDQVVAYFYQDHLLNVSKGEALTVTLESQTFDTVLEGGTQTPIGYAVALTNDDAIKTNSQFVLMPTEAGVIILRARTLFPSGGDYTLSVSRGPPQP